MINKSITGYEPLDIILRKNNGLLLYQENHMSVLNKVFGFDLKYTNKIRKVLSKKKKDDLLKLEPEIRKAGEERGVPKKAIDYAWKAMLDSANYSFCLSHAASYAALGAQMTYLKFKYPQSFFLHCLKLSHDMPDPRQEIHLITQEISRFGIKLLPPDVLKSGLDFQKEGEDIRFGLSSVKSISSKSFDSLRKFLKEKKTNKFEVFQAGMNSKINVGQMTALIYTGALDSLGFGEDRRLVALECAGFYQLKDQERAYLLEFGDKYDYSFGKAYKCIDDWVWENGKKVARKTRNNTISKNLETYRQIYKANNDNKSFAIWKFEKSLLGYAYSYCLRDVFACPENVSNVPYAIEQPEGNNVSVIGEVSEVTLWNSQRGNQCLKIKITDEFSSIYAMLVGKDKIELLKQQNLIPSQDDIVVAMGNKNDSEDCFWLDKISIQDVHVVFKKSDLTKMLKKEEEKV